MWVCGVVDGIGRVVVDDCHYSKRTTQETWTKVKESCFLFPTSLPNQEWCHWPRPGMSNACARTSLPRREPSHC